MARLEAKVVQDIPANRLLALGGINSDGNPEEGWETIYIKPSELGWIPDFVTSTELKEGSFVNVTISNNPIWRVESAQNLPAGTLVMCDADGRVKTYRPEDGNHIGYTTHSVQAGEVVEIVRKYGQMPTNQTEAMAADHENPSILDGNVKEVTEALEGLNKQELEALLAEEREDKNRKSIIDHIENLLNEGE